MILKKIILFLILFVFIFNIPGICANRLSLDRAIDIAIQKNKDLKFRRVDLDIDRIRESQAKLKFYPKIKASADLVDQDGLPYNSHTTTLTQPIYHFGNLRNNLEARRALTLGTKLGVIARAILLEKQVTQAYMRILKNQAFLIIRADAIRRSREQLKLVQEDIKKGARGEEAALRWKVLINNLQEDDLKDRYNLELSMIDLKTLMEMDPAEKLKLVAYGSEEFDTDLEEFKTLQNEMELNELIDVMFEYSLYLNPIVRQRKMDVKAALYDLRAERADKMPKINFAPEYSADGDATPNWTVGFKISVFLLDAGDWKEVEIRKKRMEQAKLSRMIFLRDLRSKIRVNYAKLMSSMAQVSLKRKQAEKAANYLERLTEKYQKGEVSDVALVDAHQSYYQNRFSEVDAIYNYYIEREELYSLIGFSDHRQTLTLQEFMETKDKSKIRIHGAIDRGGPVFKHASRGEIDKIKQLVRKDPSLVSKRNNLGWTVLHWAAYRGSLPLAGFLVEKGADVNARTKTGMTPVYLAATEGHAKLVKYFINNGADVNITAGRTLWTPLHRSARKGFLEVTKLLIKAGADVNARSLAGWEPLHEAAEEGFPKIVKLLMKNDADVNAKNNAGKTPLQLSVAAGNDKVTDILKKAGAKLK